MEQMTAVALAPPFSKKVQNDKLEPNLGCYINPVPYGCLQCSLPACIYDDPKLAHQYAVRKKDKAIMESWRPGMTGEEVAALWNMNRRTIWSIKQRYQTQATQSPGT